MKNKVNACENFIKVIIWKINHNYLYDIYIVRSTNRSKTLSNQPNKSNHPKHNHASHPILNHRESSRIPKPRTHTNTQWAKFHRAASRGHIHTCGRATFPPDKKQSHNNINPLARIPGDFSRGRRRCGACARLSSSFRRAIMRDSRASRNALLQFSPGLFHLPLTCIQRHLLLRNNTNRLPSRTPEKRNQPMSPGTALVYNFPENSGKKNFFFIPCHSTDLSWKRFPAIGGCDWERFTCERAGRATDGPGYVVVARARSRRS